jgi:hypothetical protein
MSLLEFPEWPPIVPLHVPVARRPSPASAPAVRAGARPRPSLDRAQPFSQSWLDEQTRYWTGELPQRGAPASASPAPARPASRSRRPVALNPVLMACAVCFDRVPPADVVVAGRAEIRCHPCAAAIACRVKAMRAGLRLVV